MYRSVARGQSLSNLHHVRDASLPDAKNGFTTFFYRATHPYGMPHSAHHKPLPACTAVRPATVGGFFSANSRLTGNGKTMNNEQ
jgi:hypothetical protein